jgi:hypothetical protein
MESEDLWPSVGIRWVDTIPHLRSDSNEFGFDIFSFGDYDINSFFSEWLYTFCYVYMATSILSRVMGSGEIVWWMRCHPIE